MNKYLGVTLLGCGLLMTSCSLVPTPTNVNTNATVIPWEMETGTTMNANSNTSSGVVIEENIRVSAPVAGNIVTSPLTLEGSARLWFFEASFPVTIVDDSGTVLFEGSVEAIDDWMTTSFVPFKKTITFDTPSTPAGRIIFMKSNPSGLPENDERFEMPVRFQ